MSNALATDPLKLVYQPSVYLIGQSEVRFDALCRFLSDHGVLGWESSTEVGSQLLPEIGGRLCYMSFANPRPGGNRAYLDRIRSEKHGSVFEHAVFTMIFVGVSRSLTHELVRHRAGMSYSQLSQRYVDSSDVAFVVPLPILKLAKVYEENRNTPDQYRDSWPQGACRMFEAFLRDCEHARERYRGWINCYENDDEYGFLTATEKTARRKEARGAARAVLPNCTETKIQVTGNARAWRTFLEQRGSKGADAEIRRLANVVLDTLRSAAPNLFGDYTTERMEDGTHSITTPHTKI